MLGLRNPTKCPKVTQSSKDYNPQENTDHEVTADTEVNAPYSYVSDITNGCQVGYKYFDMTNTTRLKIETRYAKGKIQILDQLDGKVIAEKALKEGKEWTETELLFEPGRIVASQIDGDIKKCPLFLRYIGSGGIEMLSFTLS